MPKLSTVEMERRRRHIAEAARQCFIRGGIERTSMDDICRQAGISKGAIYGHFASKDELVLEVMDIGAAGMDRLGAAISLQDLRGLLEAFPFLPASDEEIARLEFELATRAFADPVLRERLARNLDTLESVIRRALHGLVTRGDIKLRLPEKVAAQLVVRDLLGSFWLRSVLSKSRADIGRDSVGKLLEVILE